MKNYLLLFFIIVGGPKVFANLESINDFKPGLYQGTKMGAFPVSPGEANCFVNVIKVFPLQGIVIEVEGRTEFLNYNSEIKKDNTIYREESFSSLNFDTQFMSFSNEVHPIMQLYNYTDGPAFRSTEKTWDCVSLSKI